MPELVLQLTRAGFLALLWLFVLVALRVVRSDLYAASGLRALVPRVLAGPFATTEVLIRHDAERVVLAIWPELAG